MSNKDDDILTKSAAKRAVEEIERLGSVAGGIGVIATLLAAIFALFVPNQGEQAKQVASFAAIILAVLSVSIVYVQRQRAARYRVVEPEPLAPSAALRGLLPFEEGDELPGRKRNVQDLYTLIASTTFRFGVVWGESGTGKTSLLRAGLVPTLRKNGFLPIYVPKPTQDPREAIRTTLQKAAIDSGDGSNQDIKTRLCALAPKGKNVVVILDQFEEFFLTNRTREAQADFIQWLGEAVADDRLPIVFLVSIRADFLYHLQNLAPNIPEPTSPRTTYQLQNFNTIQARQIFTAAAKADGIPFEQALIDAVVSDLETDGFVRPAELQIVGTRLKRKDIFTLNKYVAAGRSKGILSSYISEEIKQSANEQTARLVLRLMTADVVEAKSPTDLSFDDIERGIGGTQQTALHEQVQNILNQFVAARILIHTEDDKYNLVHDYLAPYVHIATEGVETKVERANHLLKRYLAEYNEDRKTRIPFQRVRLIEKYASSEAKSQEKARELLRKSVVAFYVSLGVIIAVVLIPLLGIYLFLANSYYISSETTGGYQFVVVRAGHPELKFVPGFDQVVIQTDFVFADVVKNPKIRQEITGEQMTGFWFDQASGGYPTWQDRIITRLLPTLQARTVGWLGQPQRAAELLLQTIKDPKTDSTSRANAVSALTQLAVSDPQIVTSDAILSPVNIIIDPHVGSSLRNVTVEALGELAQTNPQAVTLDIARPVTAMVTDSHANSALRVGAIRALDLLGQVNPQIVTQDMIQYLLSVLEDPKADSDLRAAAGKALADLNENKGQVLASQLTEALPDLVTDAKADSSLRIAAAEALGQLASRNPKIVTREIVQSLSDIALNKELDPSLREDATEALGKLIEANPQVITPDVVQPLISSLTDPSLSDAVRSSSARLLGRLVQADPSVITTKIIQTMITILKDSEASSTLRGSVALSLGQFAHANPQVVTTEMTQTLLNIASDAQLTDSLRIAASQAVEAMSMTTPEVILSQQDRLNQQSIIQQARPYISGALAQAYYARAFKLGGVATASNFYPMLTDRTDSRGRIIASFVLYLIAVNDPSQEKLIRAQLQELQGGSKPDLRISASKTLEMLSIGDWVLDVEAHPEQLKHIKSRLDALTSSSEAHIAFAASVALDQIANIEKKK